MSKSSRIRGGWDDKQAVNSISDVDNKIELQHHHLQEQQPPNAVLESLSIATSNLVIRNEVNVTIQSMLSDLETSYNLGQQLTNELSINALQKKLKIAENELNERRAYDNQRSSYLRRVGDNFVGELWALSVKLSQLEKWKLENSDKIDSYEELKRSLDRSEEMIRSLRRTASLNRNAFVAASEKKGVSSVGAELMEIDEKKDAELAMVDTSSSTVAELVEKKNEQMQVSDVLRAANGSMQVETEEAIVADGQKRVFSTQDSTQDEKAADDSIETTRPVDGSNAITTSSEDASAGAVSIMTTRQSEFQAQQVVVRKEEDEVPASLESLEEASLLEIFSFMEAVDVVNTACVNVSFYSRVDSLFGLSGTNPASAANDEISPEDAMAIAAAAEEDGGVHEDDEASGAAVSTTTTTTAASSSVTATATGTAASKPVGETNPQPDPKPPEPQPQLQSLSTSTPTPTFFQRKLVSTSLGEQSGPGQRLANVFSMLQPKTQQQQQQQSTQGQQQQAQLGSHQGKNAIPHLQQQKQTLQPGKDGSGVGAGSSSGTSAKDGQIGSGGGGDTANITKSLASMAGSMADKLTPSELGVIISMTEKLKQKDRDIKQITAEREDLAARLEGTEAVKEFLISKVRDTERSLKKSHDDSIRIMQQSSSDQEVIAFLDSRVKELERLNREGKELYKKEKEDYTAHREKYEKKLTVLEDMLRFERQQLSDQEKEWKATKKVLVKEVKLCRAQLLELKGERDALRRKNDQLKQALLTMDSNPAP